MLHVSTFGSRLFQVDMPETDFISEWDLATTNRPTAGLMQFTTIDGAKVYIPCSAVSSVVVE